MLAREEKLRVLDIVAQKERQVIITSVSERLPEVGAGINCNVPQQSFCVYDFEYPLEC